MAKNSHAPLFIAMICIFAQFGQIQPGHAADPGEEFLDQITRFDSNRDHWASPGQGRPLIARFAMADGTLYSIIVPRKPFNDEGKWTKGSLGNRAVIFWTYGPKTDFKPVLSRGSTTLSYIANGEHSYLEVRLRGQSPLDMAQLDFRVQKGPNGLPPAVTLVRPHDLTVTASMILNLNEADFESIYKINAKQLLMHALAGCTIY